MTIQILKKKIKTAINKKVMYICKKKYVDLIFVYKLLLSFCKKLNIFKDISKLLKITMFFTLFKTYLKHF